MSTNLDNLIAQGIAAAKAGNRVEARKVFEFVLKQDKANVAAWWWLAQVIDDQQRRSKCLEKSRSAAAKSEQGFAVYRSLLEESGASSLPRYELAKNSQSLGGICPICTTTPKVSETIVICPTCNLAHHSECWEDGVYHCGRFACDGSGLVDHNSPVRVESAAASEAAVVVGDEEIPEETPYLSREAQEASFVGRLQRHAAAQQATRMMIGGLVRQAIVEDVAREVRSRQEAEQKRREQEQRQMELVARVMSAFLAGLIPGIILAIATFRYSQSWAIALFTIYLTAVGLATAASRAVVTNDRATGLYYLLPKAVAVVIMYVSFEQWGSGILAVVLAYVGDVFLVDRILRIRTLYEHRAFIVYSTLALTVWGVARFVVFASP